MADIDLTVPEDAFVDNDMDFERDSEYFDHLRKINDVFYDQIKISDQKAAYIFTFILAFLVSSSEARGVFTLDRYMTGNLPQIAASLLLAAASIFSALCAISVVMPRKSAKTSSLFWGAWMRHRQEFLDAARRKDPNYLFREYVSNVDTLAEIARAKYRFAGLAFRGLMLSVVGYVLVLMTASH